MDQYRRLLQESAARGDVLALRKLIEQGQSEILRQTFPESLNTVLHLAARYGQLEFMREVVKWCPEMVSAENVELETPLHEACREGDLNMVRFLLEADPWIIYKVNCREESVLFTACERGKFDVVKHLLSICPRLLMLEVDMGTNSLHVAASSGNTDIVKEILKLRPDLAWKKKSDGCTPLHLACSKGHLETTRELVKLNSDVCSIQDNEGRIPLHHAAIRGRINVIDEMLCSSLESFEFKTNNGETILHLAVKNNQYEVVKFLVETIDITKLLNVADSDGNTVLHLATSRKLTAMLTYLLKIGVDVNALNRKGYTALDVIETDASNSGALAIAPALMEAGGKRCDQLSPLSVEIQQVPDESPLPNGLPRSHHHHHHHHRHPSRQNRRRAKRVQLHNEGLRSARKTITIVAVLIATVSFTAGIAPPGGFNQVTGKALRGNQAAFKVFIICNIMALFLSIGIVNVLVSIIPFTQKTMMKLLTATHKVMWISTLLMTVAYIAAIWTIMPDETGARWVTIELTLIGGGCTVVLFFGLGFMLARHWRNKYKWRKRKERRVIDESPNNSNISIVGELGKTKNSRDISSNSDVDSSDHGYHLF